MSLFTIDIIIVLTTIEKNPNEQMNTGNLELRCFGNF